MNTGATIGNTMAAIGLGGAIFDKAVPTVAGTFYYLGILLAGLCIIVPWVAKSLRNMDKKAAPHQSYQSTEFDWH